MEFILIIVFAFVIIAAMASEKDVYDKPCNLPDSYFKRKRKQHEEAMKNGTLPKIQPGGWYETSDGRRKVLK